MTPLMKRYILHLTGMVAVAFGLSFFMIYDLSSVSFLSPMEKAGDFTVSDFYQLVADGRNVHTLEHRVVVVSIDGHSRDGITATLEAVNFCKGHVTIRVESGFPERVLNLCAARDLSFWDLVWESPTAFTCRLTRRDYHRLRRAAEAVDCTLCVVGKEGAPYFLARFRGRRVLVVSLTVCAMALFLGSFFVCEFVVEGNETVPTEEILRALEKNGVGIGSFGLALDGEDIRNHVLLDVPELSWLTVNVSGFRAYVQVRERVPVPEVVDEEHPSNVVARRPGMVLEVRAMDGVTAVGKGSVVTEGQLLISGVEDLDTFGARVLTGMGSVTARTI